MSVASATLSSPRLRFWCNYDRRHVRISGDSFASVLLERQLSTAGGCASMGVWHEHSIDLSSAWGRIQIRFFFDSVDSCANGYAGWFVDDLVVESR